MIVSNCEAKWPRTKPGEQVVKKRKIRLIAHILPLHGGHVLCVCVCLCVCCCTFKHNCHINFIFWLIIALLPDVCVKIYTKKKMSNENGSIFLGSSFFFRNRNSNEKHISFELALVLPVFFGHRLFA